MKYWYDKQLKDDLKVINALRVARKKLSRLSNLSELDRGDAANIIIMLNDLDRLSTKYFRTEKLQNPIRKINQ